MKYFIIIYLLGSINGIFGFIHIFIQYKLNFHQISFTKYIFNYIIIHYIDG